MPSFLNTEYLQVIFKNTVLLVPEVHATWVASPVTADHISFLKLFFLRLFPTKISTVTQVRNHRYWIYVDANCLIFFLFFFLILIKYRNEGGFPSLIKT